MNTQENRPVLLQVEHLKKVFPIKQSIFEAIRRRRSARSTPWTMCP